MPIPSLKLFNNDLFRELEAFQDFVDSVDRQEIQVCPEQKDRQDQRVRKKIIVTQRSL